MPPDLPPFKNAANTNIIGYANRLLALFEAASPHELKPMTLETVGLFDFGGKLHRPRDGASEVRSRHRRPAVLRLSAVPAVCDVVSRESRRQAARSRARSTPGCR